MDETTRLALFAEMEKKFFQYEQCRKKDFPDASSIAYAQGAYNVAVEMYSIATNLSSCDIHEQLWDTWINRD